MTYLVTLCAPGGETMVLAESKRTALKAARIITRDERWIHLHDTKGPFEEDPYDGEDGVYTWVTASEPQKLLKLEPIAVGVTGSMVASLLKK